MEIIKQGTEDVDKMVSILSCCWPPLTRKISGAVE